MKTNKRLQKLVDIMVKQSFDQSGRILNVNVNKYAKNLASVNGPSAIIALSDYSKKLRREVGKYTLTIESATKLNPKQVNRLKNALKADYKINEVKIVVNPNLLGGTRITVGDIVIEDSVVNKIEQMKEAIRS